MLISQTDQHIERYLRQANDQWLLTDLTLPDAALELTSIGCTLPLSAVYENIAFEREE